MKPCCSRIFFTKNIFDRLLKGSAHFSGHWTISRGREGRVDHKKQGIQVKGGSLKNTELSSNMMLLVLRDIHIMYIIQF